MDATAIAPPAVKNDSPPAADPRVDALDGEPLLAEALVAKVTKVSPASVVMMVLGAIAFLYFARPVILPIFLACVAGMALKPLIRWLSCGHIPPPLSAAVVLCLLVSGIAMGSFYLGRPAVTWINEAPQHLSSLRQRVQKYFPRAESISQAAAAVNNLGASEDEKQKVPAVELKTSAVPTGIINWTGTLLAGIGET